MSQASLENGPAARSGSGYVLAFGQNAANESA
jgi:hypothetical protein